MKRLQFIVKNLSALMKQRKSCLPARNELDENSIALGGLAKPY